MLAPVRGGLVPPATYQDIGGIALRGLLVYFSRFLLC